MPMRVLVTGGSGLVGAEVIAELYARGHRITSLDIRPSDCPLLGVTYIEGSILDYVTMSAAARGQDAIIHLAAMTGVKNCTKNAHDCIVTNAIGTQRVVDAARSAGVKTILYTSSSEVYGPDCAGVGEKAAVWPVSEYAVAKLCGEEMVRAAHNEFGIRGIVVRFFNIYGPRQECKFVIPKWAQAVRRNEPVFIFGDGEQVRTFCYVTDAARAVVDLLLHQKGLSGTFNVGSNSPVKLKRLANLFWELADKVPDIRYVGFEQSDRLHSREVFNRSPDTTKLREAVGFLPRVKLEEGILSCLTRRS